ncbi:hypothetical protein [Emergencia sp. 1XD21-10]|uniref:hypothetical protein n=1 Tax=Emergencia sp. 1XD21-10 TaxID=2304569 RepID=UPI00137AFFEA|nr:hypothetical protein [Emergencia sp. 1XD21-10]
MEKKTDRIQIKIQPSIKARAQELAEADGRTLSNYIVKLLENEINKKEAATNGNYATSFTNNTDLYMVVGDCKHIGFIGSREKAHDYYKNLDIMYKGWGVADIVAPKETVAHSWMPHWNENGKLLAANEKEVNAIREKIAQLESKIDTKTEEELKTQSGNLFSDANDEILNLNIEIAELYKMLE